MVGVTTKFCQKMYYRYLLNVRKNQGDPKFFQELLKSLQQRVGIHPPPLGCGRVLKQSPPQLLKRGLAPPLNYFEKDILMLFSSIKSPKSNQEAIIFDHNNLNLIKLTWLCACWELSPFHYNHFKYLYLYIINASIYSESCNQRVKRLIVHF